MVALAIVAIVAYMTLESRGMWEFVLPFRGRKIAAIIIVGYAIAVSTVLFQTITNNRILTPSIMGFDALYMLIQTIIVYLFGSSRLLMLDPQQRFAMEVFVMVVFSSALYFWLFVKAERSLHLLVLVGIIFGTMFRSITNFLQRLIDPNEFVVLQDAGFASFSAIDQTLLWVAAGVIVAISLVIIRMLPMFDVLTLGREMAIGLGVNYRRVITVTLVLVTALVSVSTALVGPITFFGLLVANLGYMLIGSAKHRWTIPAAALLAIIALVGGQTLLERVFSFNSTLSIIIEFFGGVMFIVLLIRGSVR